MNYKYIKCTKAKYGDRFYVLHATSPALVKINKDISLDSNMLRKIMIFSATLAYFGWTGFIDKPP